MSAQPDMTQYLGLFLQEASEQLALLEQEVLKLESDPRADRLQTIFRAAHTIKGSSRAMGFDELAELTHELESVFDSLRNGHTKVSCDLADLILAAVDLLALMVESVRKGNPSPASAAVISALRCIQSPNQPPSSATSPSTDFRWAIDEAAAQAPVYHARFRLSPDCVMKFVRAFMAISQVQERGELLASVPDAEALEEEQFDTAFELIFQSEHEISVFQEGFSDISEIEWFSVEPWQTATEGSIDFAVEAEKLSPSRVETGQTVRVDVARLDALMNLVGELVIDRTRISKIADDLASHENGPLVTELRETVAHIERITGDLQDQIMRTRMLPIDTVFNRFPRAVRDFAQKLGKEVSLVIEGAETELDRSVIEVIGDPLLHILRNSVDHGIESPELRIAAGKLAVGTVRLSAEHRDSFIVIIITDDGRGIDIDRVRQKAVNSGLVRSDVAAQMDDREVLQFIFASGLTTASELTEVSGRGVGMDIVRSNIQKLGGTIEVDSQRGQGTQITLRLPLTLAIIRGLLVRAGGAHLILPLTSVVETRFLGEQDVKRLNQNEVLVVRGRTIPLVHLADHFGLDNGSGNSETGYAVIAGVADQQLALRVDELVGEQEVVIKSLCAICGDVPGISGATILGDGNVALIADVGGIVLKDRS